MSYEGGSFRDPDGRVFLRDGMVLRGLSKHGAAQWRAASKTRFLAEAMAQGRVVRTVEQAGEGPWEVVLRHERVPFVSYPYEWGFGMLQDAALLTLDLQLAALAEGFTLKDGSAYNVQFHGARPVFIDLGSFERLEAGGVWAGYRQFCEQFLYPLMLRAYRGLPHAPWLRGRLEGVPASDAARLLGWRGALKPGVFSHVILQDRLQARHAEDAGLREEIRQAGFSAELLAAGLRRLRRLTAALDWAPPASAWSEYGRGGHYSAADAAAKEAFVREAAGTRAHALAWDLGTNSGGYARILAETADTVVALDADASIHERLHRALRDGPGDGRILPLCVDLADPSPDCGWRGAERRRLEARGTPGLTLALALVHHLRLGAGIPLADIVDWLGSLGGELVVEFVAKDDPLARRLLARKDDRYEDYTSEHFEKLLAPRFTTSRREPLAGGRRALYHLRPRAARDA